MVLKYQPIESALRRPPCRGPVGLAEGFVDGFEQVSKAINDGSCFLTLGKPGSETECKGVPTPQLRIDLFLM
jgi:hypothetical protein